ncbi:putative lea domain protein [Phaeoacremonium minimum UCRPA7]|uniref:Putative lea domain protein n=1 Tax=Phaeoacremonium minimum (strain UCR-PA7) TaxID=1286976 RepID=R8BD83_PHAM7|nr:putative lea domain protein [Phaeoacremonium minimum UCRPA7]EON97263.1 putative lea domain protein [Phaeoacremonium minimum UCRPA7]
MPVSCFQPLGLGISILPPLTRRGHGPGLILLVPDADEQMKIAEGVPSHLVKWAEEGYTVVEIQIQAIKDGGATNALSIALKALWSDERCQPEERIGIVAYDPEAWVQAAKAVAVIPSVAGVVIYADAAQETSLPVVPAPTIYHLAGKSSGRPVKSDALTVYYYESVESYKFAIPFQSAFNYTTEAISHTRSLSHLKPRMLGPYFDLELIWDEHTYYEFSDRSVEHTMSTMVQEPYVNHTPVLTGGVGRGALTNFYRSNFIFNNSADTTLELVSRSIAIDRIIDEFILKCTHDLEIDWLIPGIPPTGLKLEVPFTAVVNIRGDRLYHEHISWDQGTVLRQLGLLPEYLPFPHPLPNGKTPALGNHFEYRVPVTGTASASKLRDRGSEPSNEMLQFKIREVPVTQPAGPRSYTTAIQI